MKLEKYSSLISILKDYQDKSTGLLLSEEEIISHVMTFFFAAHDTTSNMISMGVYELLKTRNSKKKYLSN